MSRPRSSDVDQSPIGVAAPAAPGVGGGVTPHDLARRLTGPPADAFDLPRRKRGAEALV